MKRVFVLIMIILLCFSASAEINWQELSNDEIEAIINDAQQELENRNSMPDENADYEYHTDRIKFNFLGNYLLQYKEKDYLAIGFDWINISDGPLFFQLNLSIRAFQHGHQVDEDTPAFLCDRLVDEVLPGYGFTSYVAFPVHGSGEFTVYIDDLFDIATDNFPDIEYTVDPYHLPILELK